MNFEVYFHNRKEKKEHQELKFQMAPEYVDVEVDSKLSGMHTVKYLRTEYILTLIEEHTTSTPPI